MTYTSLSQVVSGMSAANMSHQHCCNLSGNCFSYQWKDSGSWSSSLEDPYPFLSFLELLYLMLSWPISSNILTYFSLSTGGMVSVPSDLCHVRQRLSCYSDSSSSINTYSSHVTPRSKISTVGVPRPMPRRHDNNEDNSDNSDESVSSKNAPVQFHLGENR